MDADFHRNNTETEKQAEEWYSKGLAFLDLESLDQAYACFRHGIEISPTHARLQFALGQAFDAGIGVEKDDSKAVEWYRKAADGGLPEAQYALGEHYLCEVEPIKKNWQEATKWFRRAAEQGHSDAQLRLAGMHEDGLGIPQDLSGAVYWYRKAADQGNVQAEAALEQYETD